MNTAKVIKPLKIEQRCAQLIIEELPSLVCFLKQNFCGPELSGLTLQQHRLMAALLDRPCSTTALAEELGVSLPAISRMTQQLIESGWVQKETTKQDKRQILLSLTKQGLLTIRGSRQQSLAKLVPRLDSLTPKQKNTIIEAFEILNQLTNNS